MSAIGGSASKAPVVLRPFWRYYGGKWRAAPRYPAPEHETIIEPFAGAAGYSMRHHTRNVILVEKYAVIAEMWRYLIGVSPHEIRAIPCVDHIDDLPGWVPAGGRALVGFAMNDASVSPCRQLSVTLKKSRSEAGRAMNGWAEARRDRVANQVDHIRHWRVIEGDYTSAPNVDATWFVDPPYRGRAGEYYAEPASAIDYDALGAWCRSRRGQSIVCENDGATWLPFRHFENAEASNMSGRGGKSAEAIWTGGVP